MTDIGSMNSLELAAYIAELTESNKLRMATLKALLKARAAQEAATGQSPGGTGNPMEA